jgi:hypothetical protein
MSGEAEGRHDGSSVADMPSFIQGMQGCIHDTTNREGRLIVSLLLALTFTFGRPEVQTFDRFV